MNKCLSSKLSFIISSSLLASLLILNGIILGKLINPTSPTSTPIPTSKATSIPTVTPTPVITIIGEVDFLVNGTVVENTTQPYVISGPDRDIEVRTRGREEEIILEDEVWCEWIFLPPLQLKIEEGKCRIQIPAGVEGNQVVRVRVRSKDNTNVQGELPLRSLMLSLQKEER